MTPSHINTDTVYLWRHLRDTGQWWSAHEIYQHWRPTFTLHEIQQQLLSMLNLGAIQRRIHLERPGEIVYAVTDSCTPLPGQSLTPSAAPC